MNIKHGTLQEKSNVSHFILLYLKDFFLGSDKNLPTDNSSGQELAEKRPWLQIIGVIDLITSDESA